MNQPVKILVADDDRTIRRNLMLFLRAEGFETLEATDGVRPWPTSPAMRPTRCCST